MTRCHHIQTMLAAYESRELSALERAIVDDHLAECAACRDELQLLREIGTTLAGLPPVTCPDRVTDAIHAAIDREQESPAPARQVRWWQTAGVAGLAAAAVLLVVLMPRRDTTPDVAVPAATLDTARVSAAELADARQDLLWTLAYAASVLDRTEKHSLGTVVRELRDRMPDSHAATFGNGNG